MTVSLQPAQLRPFHGPAKSKEGASCLVGLTCLTPSCLRRLRTQELCESRGGRSGLPVPNKPDGFCGRKATLKGKAEPLNFYLSATSASITCTVLSVVLNSLIIHRNVSIATRQAIPYPYKLSELAENPKLKEPG